MQSGAISLEWESPHGSFQGLTSVRFPRRFRRPPKVFLTVNGSNLNWPPRVQVAATNVTTKGFDIDYRVDGDFEGFDRAVLVAWMAVK